MLDRLKISKSARAILLLVAVLLLSHAEASAGEWPPAPRNLQETVEYTLRRAPAAVLGRLVSYSVRANSPGWAIRFMTLGDVRLADGSQFTSDSVTVRYFVYSESRTAIDDTLEALAKRHERMLVFLNMRTDPPSTINGIHGLRFIRPSEPMFRRVMQEIRKAAKAHPLAQVVRGSESVADVAIEAGWTGVLDADVNTKPYYSLKARVLRQYGGGHSLPDSIEIVSHNSLFLATFAGCTMTVGLNKLSEGRYLIALDETALIQNVDGRLFFYGKSACAQRLKAKSR